jgi:hypothetical protein
MAAMHTPWSEVPVFPQGKSTGYAYPPGVRLHQQDKSHQHINRKNPISTSTGQTPSAHPGGTQLPGHGRQAVQVPWSVSLPSTRLQMSVPLARQMPHMSGPAAS